MDFQQVDQYNWVMNTDRNAGAAVTVFDLDMSDPGWLRCQTDSVVKAIVSRHPTENKFQVIITCGPVADEFGRQAEKRK